MVRYHCIVSLIFSPLLIVMISSMIGAVANTRMMNGDHRIVYIMYPKILIIFSTFNIVITSNMFLVSIIGGVINAKREEAVVDLTL